MVKKEGFENVDYYSTGTPEERAVWTYWCPKNQETPRPYESSFNKLYDSIFIYPFTLGITYVDTNVKKSYVGLRTK